MKKRILIPLLLAACLMCGCAKEVGRVEVCRTYIPESDQYEVTYKVTYDDGTTEMIVVEED